MLILIQCDSVQNWKKQLFDYDSIMMLECTLIVKKEETSRLKIFGQNLLTGILRPSHKSLMRAQE